jgi:hypothetical protein
MSAGGVTSSSTQGQQKQDVDKRVEKLEERLDALLSGKVELEIHELSVAPRSKLRVACE